MFQRLESAEENTYYGIEVEEWDQFEFCLQQERIIHAICQTFGIKHKTFFQPSLYSIHREYEEEELEKMLEAYEAIWDEEKGKLTSFSQDERQFIEDTI